MSDGAVGEFVTYREHTAFGDRVITRLHELEMRQARLDHMPALLAETNAKLDRLIERATATGPAAPQETGAVLALHNAADAVRAMAGNRTGGQPFPLLWAALGAMALAIAYLGWRVVVG